MKPVKSAHFIKSLDTLTPNKNFAKKQKLRQKRLEKDAQDEWPPLRREKLKALKAAKKESSKPVKKTSAKTQKTKKAGAASTTKAVTKAAKETTTKAKKQSKRRVINEIANAATGRETLRKTQARELVKKKKAAKAQKTPAPAKSKKQSSTVAAVKQAAAGKRAMVKEVRVSRKQRSAKQELLEEENEDEDGAPLLSTSEMERALLQRTISGDDAFAAGGRGGSAYGHAQALDVRDDPTLYPPLALYDDYAEKKSGETVSEDKILTDANRYFSDMRRRERQLNLAAVRHIAKMKAINRQGGDKDGFRYVVPRNTKHLVRQMMLNGAQQTEEANVDPDTLVSTFLGDGVEETESDKPQRRRRKRSATLSDFYQFQVSKRWTQNAEKFLKRGRASKSMFEAKKRQRSIRKM